MIDRRHELISLKRHFAFGKNWASYAKGIGDREITDAISALKRLLGDTDLAGKRFIDVGCGSGLHSLAALKLGAAEVVAVDIDPDSVETTKAVLELHAQGSRWQAEVASVFDLDGEKLGLFDVVYSWGVLHHTGAMLKAIERATNLVGKGGFFVTSLYRKTWLCWLWKLEKKWYSCASGQAQGLARSAYIRLLAEKLRVQGHSVNDYVKNYHSNRGMDFYHDVHDWMGGYPYESILPKEMNHVMEKLDFRQVRSFVSPGRFLGRNPGIFGSGCDEYVYRRR